MVELPSFVAEHGIVRLLHSVVGGMLVFSVEQGADEVDIGITAENGDLVCVRQ